MEPTALFSVCRLIRSEVMVEYERWLDADSRVTLAVAAGLAHYTPANEHAWEADFQLARSPIAASTASERDRCPIQIALRARG